MNSIIASVDILAVRLFLVLADLSHNLDLYENETT